MSFQWQGNQPQRLMQRGPAETMALKYGAIAARVAGQLPREVSQALDELLEVDADESVSRLQWIKENPAKPSPAAMRRLAEKLAAIKTTGVLGIDLEWLNRNYQRALFHYVRQCSAHRLRELARPRRRTALVCFLRQSYRDAVDQAAAEPRQLADQQTVAGLERRIEEMLGTLQSGDRSDSFARRSWTR